jgi:S-adenosylmethionine:tRNA ribosyltransferase-isomerase
MLELAAINIPKELVAQHPILDRDKCRLLLLDRTSGQIEHRTFRDVLGFVKPGDLFVFNNSRVIKARFEAFKASGGKIELFLIRPVDDTGSLETNPTKWHCLIRGKNIKEGLRIEITKDGIGANVISLLSDGTFYVEFDSKADIPSLMELFGKLPLPPYIKRLPDVDDEKYYQTVFANIDGSVAAPTAALHFTDEILAEMVNLGVGKEFLTLHVGYGTFSTVRDIKDHIMHSEFYTVPDTLAESIRNCKNRGGRVWAVGTTVVRTLESIFDEDINLLSQSGFTSLFIKPGYKFKVVDAMITNFHHPDTTLIYLVSAFGGLDNIVRAYSDAVSKRYRLLSYGDAMAIF